VTKSIVPVPVLVSVITITMSLSGTALFGGCVFAIGSRMHCLDWGDEPSGSVSVTVYWLPPALGATGNYVQC
jgi:hypothetical protein